MTTTTTTTVASMDAIRELDGHGRRHGHGRAAVAARKELLRTLRCGWCAEVEAEAIRLGFDKTWRP